LVAYLTDLGAQDVFVTSAWIASQLRYTPTPPGNTTAKFWKTSAGEYSQWGKDILFVANDLGEDAKPWTPRGVCL
jgi:hypothetical protein